MLDTFPTFSHLQDAQRTELAKLASRAFWAAEQGLVHLVREERIDTDRFAYIAVARPKPKSATSHRMTCSACSPYASRHSVPERRSA